MLDFGTDLGQDGARMKNPCGLSHPESANLIHVSGKILGFFDVLNVENMENKNRTSELIDDIMFHLRQDGLIKRLSIRQLANLLGFSHTQIYIMINKDSLTVDFIRELKKKYGRYKISYTYIKKNVIYKDC